MRYEGREGGIPSVDIDHEAAAFDAVTKLIQEGHRSIAMISGTLQDPANGYARYQGYKRALEQAGLPFREDYVRVGNYKYESGIEEMQYFLNLPERPTAVFSATDEMAIGAIHCIQDAGLSVPEDVSVISVDNSRIVDGASASDDGRPTDVRHRRGFDATADKADEERNRGQRDGHAAS